MTRFSALTRFALTVAAAVAAAAAVPAFADDITIETMPFTSSLTRAEVLADLEQHRRSGADRWIETYEPMVAITSQRTRDEVTAEYIAARDQVAALNGEDSGSMQFARARIPQQSAQYAALPVVAE